MGVSPARVSLQESAAPEPGCQGARGSAGSCSREARTEGHPRSPGLGLRFARRGVTRGHAGLRGNNSDSLDPGLLPGDQRGLLSYLAHLWREAVEEGVWGAGRHGRGGAASGDGGRGGGS